MKTKTVRLPKKGAVAKITEEQKKLRRRPASPKLREVLHKKNDTTEESQKKIVRSPKRNPDIGL